MRAQTTHPAIPAPLHGLLIEADRAPAQDSLLARLQLPRLCRPPAHGLYLRLDDTGLTLCHAAGRRAIAVRADFVTGSMGYRTARLSPRRETLARACGLHRRASLKVIDATAGLGRDGFVLAAAGAEVTLLERSPVVAALLEDGLHRAAGVPPACGPVARMHLVHSDAEIFLRGLPLAERPDVVYLDPMFAPRGRGGAAGKEMQLLQRLLGTPAADAPLLCAARAAAPRVVVKRHRHATPLAGEPPSHTLTGRAARFDVYQRPG